jgi:uncharacterized protein with FMN-binding domain
VVVVGGVALALNRGKKHAPQSNTNTTVNSSISFKDGSYKSEGTYDSPGGIHKVQVELILKDGVITDSIVTADSSDSESRQYQNKFLNGYKSLVIGKKVDSITLGRVSGSSLTSKGFNEAVQKIGAQAKQ